MQYVAIYNAKGHVLQTSALQRVLILAIFFQEIHVQGGADDYQCYSRHGECVAVSPAESVARH